MQNENIQQWKVTDWNRIITKNIDTGRYHWSDGAGSGKCWVEEENDRLILGGYQTYGAAMHADDSHPELQKEAEEDNRKHHERLATLPEWDKTTNVVHVMDVLNEVKKIVTTLKEAEFDNHKRCLICGGLTGNNSILAIVEETEATKGLPPWVCADCLKAGSEKAPPRLIAQADSLECWARQLRDVAEYDWELPRYEEWETANDKHESELAVF